MSNGNILSFPFKWIIVDNFGNLEKEDIEAFGKIEEELIAVAMIYFAIEDVVGLAACMAKPMNGATWVICKLALNKHREHKGCGSAVFEAAMQWAIEHDAKRLFIYYNSQYKICLKAQRPGLLKKGSPALRR